MTEDGMVLLRGLFNEVNDDRKVVLFSLSGNPGTYTSLEHIQKDVLLYFVVIIPQQFTMKYGECIPDTDDDITFLHYLCDISNRVLKKPKT